MNIGELFLTLGIKESADFKRLPSDLAKIGASGAKAATMIGSASKAFGMLGANLDRNIGAFSKLGLVASRVSAAMGESARDAAGEIRAMASESQRASAAIARAYQKQAATAMEAARAGRLAMSGGGGKSGILWGAAGDPFNTGGQKAAMAAMAAQLADENAARRGPGAVRMRGSRPRNAIMSALSDDLRIGGESAGSDGRTAFFRSFGSGGGGGGGTRRLRGGMPGLPSPTGREYVLGGGGYERDESVIGAPEKKRPGMIRRFMDKHGGGGGGGGGERSGGGRGGFGGNRFGALGEASSFRRVLMGAGIYQGATFFGGLADTYAQLQMRLVGLTGSQEKANEVFERLRTVARNTNTGLETTVESYVRIKNATAEMNLSEEDSYKVMTNLNTLFATSGASTMEASQGMRQLTQAFSKGKLDGDEFKTLAEAMPNILKALGKELGKTEGELRKMSKDGDLTRDMLVKMALNVKGLQKPVDTFGTSWQKFKDDMMVVAGRLVKNNNLVKAFTTILGLLANALILIANVLAPVISGIGSFIQGLKDGEVWAYALAGVLAITLIPTLVSLVTWLIRIPAILNAIKNARIAGMFTDIAKVGAAYGGGGAAGSGAGAAGAAAGAGGAAAGAAKTGGKFSKFLGTASRVLLPLVAAELLSDLSGGPLDFDKMQEFANQKFAGGSISATATQPPGQGGGKSVSVGTINVSIQANDMTDAQQKFGNALGTEIDKLLRQTSFGG